jgi:hypothetical protein
MSLNPVRLCRRLIAAALLGGTSFVATPDTAQGAFVADSMVTITGDSSTSGPGYFSGTVAVDNISPNTAVIQITLTNTSPVANGGYITAFAFNDPNSSGKGNISTVTSFTQSYAPLGNPPDSQMTLIGGPTYTNTISGSPYGSFDIGAATGGDFLGSGSPLPGIEVGQTGTFTFTVSGTNLDKLTAAGIMSTLSQGGNQSAALLVRFRGFANGDSDKVVAGVNGPPVVPQETVPAPPGVLLGLIGLGGCLLGRAFRRRVAAPAAV